MLSPQSIQSLLDSELNKLADGIRASVPVVSGRTRDSIRVVTEQNKGTIFGRQAFYVLEYGRRGGKVPRGFYYIILAWAQQKGIQVENIKSFAWHTANKIAREGTELNRRGGEHNIYSDKIPQTVAEINRQLGLLLKMEVQSIMRS
jgi:hypothetical protein